MADWPDIIINALGIGSTIQNAEKTVLGTIDATMQVAVTSLSIGAAINKNPLFAVGEVIASGPAFATSTAVFGVDYLNGKLGSTPAGTARFYGDISTILGDILLYVGGAATLISTPASKALAVSINAFGDGLTISGLVAQYDANHNVSPPSALVSSIQSTIALLKSGLSSVSAELSSSSNPLLSQWNTVQSVLLGLFNPIYAAITSTNSSVYSANVTATYNAIGGIYSNFSNLYNAIINDNPPLAQTTAQQQSDELTTLTNIYQQSGYYIVEQGDTPQSIVGSLSNGGITANGVDATALLRINAVFGVTTFGLGTILHVPLVPSVAPNPAGAFSELGATDVFDPTNNRMYTVGSSLDGHDTGALIIDTPISGGFATFDAGTFSGVVMQPNGQVAVGLALPDSTLLGTLAFNTGTDAGTLTLSDGLAIPVPGGLAVHLTTDSAATPEATLINYLSELGVSDTSSQLDSDDFNYLNPIPQSTDGVNIVDYGIVNGHDEVFYDFPNGGGASPNISGKSGAFNIIQVDDIHFARATISNIQEFVFLDGGAATLTQTQFDEVSEIGGTGLVIAATGGTFDLRTNVNGDISLTASDWSGTTLIGNDQNGETLSASLLGNDTLQAGNGTGDTLVAGDGVDTITGGTGGDTFVVGDGLAVGSVVTGSGNGNTLQTSADSDISPVTITGMQVLNVYGDQGTTNGDYFITLTAAELNEFSSINTGISYNMGNTFVGQGDVFLTITAAAGGVYSLSGKSISQAGGGANGTTTSTLIAGTDDGTTLIGNTDPGETLVASALGSDTLEGGSGAGDTLVAGSGNDSMQGNGGNVIYEITDGTSGTDTINNYHTDNGQSVIVFENAASTDVVASRSGNDLVLTFGDDPVIVQNYFLGANYQVASIRFTDGVSWTPQNIPITTPPSVSLDPDGVGVLDSVTGIEWLPLTDTLGYTYSQVFGGGDPLVPQGYVLATDAQILTLYKDAGFSPAVGVDGFVTASDVSDGGALFNSFAALFGKTNATDNLTSGLSASPEFQVANGVASGLTNNAVYGPSSATFDHSDSVATQTPDNIAINTTLVTNEAEFLYKVSLPTLAGASITLNNGTVTVAIAGGQTVGLGPLVTDFSGSIPSLILQGPGTADIVGPAIISDLEVTSVASLVLQGGTVTTDPVTIDAGGNVMGYGTITGNETANGTITAKGGTLDITGNVSGSGTLTIASGASLQLEGTIAATESVIFASGGDALILGASGNVLAPVSGFGLGDSIALEGQQVTSAVYNATTKALAITGSTGTTFTLSLAGTYQQSNFTVASGDVVFSAAAVPPVISSATPTTVEKSQTTVIGTVTPGVAADTLTLTETAGAGALSLGAAQANGTQQVIYTAPASVAASTKDAVSYQVKDQKNGTSVTGSASVQLDAGPAVASLPFVPGAANVAVTVATATPGVPGDTLSLVITQAPQSGTVALHGSSVQFTPTTSSNLLKPVTFSFDVKDQLGGTTPVRTVIVGGDLANVVTGNALGNTDIGLGNGLNKITLAGSGNVVDAGNGANGISGGVSNNTVILGNGLDSVNLSGGGNTITLGNGGDAVTVGGTGNQINLGNGIDVVHGGTGDTINLAKTALTIYGTNEMLFIGAGSAAVSDFSTGLDFKIGPTAGVDVLAHFASDPSGVVDLIGGIGGFKTTAAVLTALKSDGHGGTLLSFGSGSSLDFTGLASSQLHASNFQIG